MILNTLARDDVWRHLPGLEKLAARSYPSTPFNKLGVKVDYCTVPPTFDLFRLEDDTIPDDDARCVARKPTRQAALHSSKTLLSLTTRQGSSGYRWTVMMDVTSRASFQRLSEQNHHKIQRMVGRDIKGRALETRMDGIDMIMSVLNLKDATVALSMPPHPVERLRKRLSDVMGNGERLAGEYALFEMMFRQMLKI